MNGTVRISLNVTRRSPCVVLHANDMDITHVALEHPHTHGASPICLGNSVKHIWASTSAHVHVLMRCRIIAMHCPIKSFCSVDLPCLQGCQAEGLERAVFAPSQAHCENMNTPECIVLYLSV